MYSFSNKQSFAKELVLPNFLFRFTVVSFAVLTVFFVAMGVARAADPAPEIYQVLPDKGDIAGGDSVVVKGANFKNGAIYKLGGGLWQPATFYNVNTLIVTTTASSAGPATLFIENPDALGDAEEIFTFTDGPRINFVSPLKMRTTGNQELKLYCDAISDVPAEITVKIDGSVVAVNSVAETSPSESGLGDYVVKLTAPAHPAGNVNVEVTSLDTGKTDVKTNGLIYAVPEVTYVNKPVISPPVDNVSFKVEADYIDANVQVILRGSSQNFECNGESVTGDSISCDLDVLLAPADRYDLVLKMSDGTEGILPDAVRIGPEASITVQIDSISPVSGPMVGGTVVTIKGSGFGLSPEVSFGDVNATEYSLRTDTEIIVKVPASVISGQVNVTVAGAVRLNFFEYTAGGGGIGTEGCYQFAGEGKYVSVNGVNNSGRIYFEDPSPLVGPSNLPAEAYRACVLDPDPAEAIKPYEMRGWAWDDNLGWVSFYCKGGDNLGVGCGSVDYGVTLDNDGKFDGYAWGDNVGWIKFNNSGFSQVKVNTNEQACQGYVYGVTKPNDFPAQSGCANHIEKDVYAWSDNLGWINFDGVVVPWYELTKKIKDDTIQLQIPVHPRAMSIGDVPWANGTAFYDISLKVQDVEGNALNPARYSVHAKPIWIADSVKLDQTNPQSKLNNASCGNGGMQAVDKLCSDMPLKVVGVDGEYGFKMTSLAPTTNMNYTVISDGEGNTTEFNHEKFIAPLNYPRVESNDLILKGMELYILDNAFPVDREEHCAYPGKSLDCAGSARLLTILKAGGVSYEAPHIFKFKPVVTVPGFDDVKKTDYMSLQRDTANALTMQTACGEAGATSACDSQIEFDMGLSSGFNLVYDENEDGNFDSDEPSEKFMLSANIGTKDINVAAICPDGKCSAFAGNPFIYSVVNYDAGGGKIVRYFANKLPRIRGSLVVNPVAEVRGNVYSTGVVSLQEGKEIRSLGEVSTNILRNTIFRNVSALIAGANVTAGGGRVGGAGEDLDKYLDFVPEDGGSGGKKLLPDENGYPQVLYFKGGDVEIEDEMTLEWSGERTIIVEGGNVFIDTDLYNGANSNSKLGLIVLKDFTKPVDKQGGNIYIENSVTNIQANIFADGAVMSYLGDTDASATVKGKTFGNLPKFDSEDDRFDKLRNQLFIQGSIASGNSIGGANANPPILGDGTQVGPGEGVYGDAPTDRSLARLFDLNFLRYYGLALELDTVTNEPIDQQCEDLSPGSGTDPEAVCYNIQLTAFDSADSENSGDLLPMEDVYGVSPAKGLPDKSYSPVYIFFDPPTATLPGFSTAGNVDIEIKAQ